MAAYQIFIIALYDSCTLWLIANEGVSFNLLSCYSRYLGETVAVKKVKEERETDIRHLRKLNHPNIVQFRYRQPSQHCTVQVQV